MKTKFVDGEQVYGCLACLDQGWVICWHPSAIVAINEAFAGQPAPGPAWRLDPRWQEAKRRRAVYEEHALRCTCAAGMAKNEKVPTYNANIHCMYESGHPERVLRWLAERRGRVA